VSAGETGADVIVFGAGFTGCVVALELARAGRRTVVVDVGDGAPPGPGHVPSGPPLLYVNAIRRWGHDGARELWELQREAHAELRALMSEWGHDCGYHAAGGFTAALTRPEGLALANGEDQLREDGFAGEFVDAYMFEARFAVQGFAAAYWAEEEAVLDAVALEGAAETAARLAGAGLAGPLDGTPEVTREGVRATAREGVVHAPMAVLASPSALPAAGPYFTGRFEARRCQGKSWRLPDAVLVPGPMRLCAGGAGWAVVRGRLLVETSGELDPASFIATHLTEPLGPQEAEWSRLSGLSADGLPWVGAVPDLPLVAALGAADDLGYAPLLARWAALSLLTGRDHTPPRLRASRPAPSARGA
jgi:glycine/D-amino acid oxidase-like deaminating enzyme